MGKPEREGDSRGEASERGRRSGRTRVGGPTPCRWMRAQHGAGVVMGPGILGVRVLSKHDEFAGIVGRVTQGWNSSEHSTAVAGVGASTQASGPRCRTHHQPWMSTSSDRLRATRCEPYTETGNNRYNVPAPGKQQEAAAVEPQQT